MAIQYKPQANTTIHLIGKSSKIASEVYDQLLEDYPEDAIAWVKSAKWQGPTEVPLSAIDFSNKAKWHASKDPEHVNDFVQELRDGEELKPVVLINEPNNEKLIIADGHHRSLAYLKMKTNPIAYIATVDKVGGSWSRMHRQQDGLEASSQQK